jgi:hypothetical protein
MKIEYSLEKMGKVSPNEYIILVMVAISSFKELNSLLATRRREYSTGIFNLIGRGYVKNVANSSHIDAYHLVISTEGKKLLDKRSVSSITVKEPEIEKWIDDWRNLFPSGKSGGYPIKGSRKTCIKKMVSFMKSYGFDKDTIMDATRLYIDGLKGNFEYIQGAQYFIEKNKISNLGAFCEEIMEGGTGMTVEDNVINI